MTTAEANTLTNEHVAGKVNGWNVLIWTQNPHYYTPTVLNEVSKLLLAYLKDWGISGLKGAEINVVEGLITIKTIGIENLEHENYLVLEI
jgi:hypothetical protein